MTRILYAWELGAGFGHLKRMRVVARALAERGHYVTLAVRDCAAAESVFRDGEFPFFQAPLWPVRFGEQSQPPFSFSEILLGFGFADPVGLTGLVWAWRRLLESEACRLVIADYAPTAMLAARTLGIPVVECGTAFGVPPLESPMPNLRPWLDISRDRLEEADRAVLETVNAVLVGFSCDPVGRVADLFDTPGRFVDKIPEIDPYQRDSPVVYLGPLEDDEGILPEWPSGRGKRVLVYLSRGHRLSGEVAKALGRLGYPALAYAPDLASVGSDPLPQGLRVVNTPIDMARALRECDVVVSHGGAGTTTFALVQGKPQLLLPMHLEQFLTSRKVEALGAALAIDAERPAPDVSGALQRVVHEPAFAMNAQRFALGWRDWSQAASLQMFCQRCEAIAGPE